MRRCVLCIVLLVSGCARNAIFELELSLPAQPAGAPLYAVVQARVDGGFEASWDDIATSPGLPLCPRPSEGTCEDRVLDPACASIVSIVADESELERPLYVRVRFCEDPACAASSDASAPEHRVEVERAFYRGRYTQARVCLDEVPPEPALDLIERCDVRCREGSATSHCRLDGTHFCEPPN